VFRPKGKAAAPPAPGAEPMAGETVAGKPPPAGVVMDDLKRKALAVHERLCAEYGCPIPYFAAHDPLSQLVGALLSHRTRNADTGAAFRELRQRFPDWAAVRDAPTAEVEAAIAAVTWPEMKAPRLQDILRRIAERRKGTLSLDFLADMPAEAARAWLEEMPGVGPKTSASVVAYSTLRRAALPVDSHHYRVALRLGLLPAGATLERAHRLLAAQLPPDWDAQAVYDHHQVVMRHGQRVCTPRDPACRRCVLLDLCPTGRARLARPARRAPRRPGPKPTPATG
jgi:endonuclease-3